MYYSIKNDTGKQVGNVFPQVNCYNLNLAHSIPFDGLVNLDSEILFELVPKAKLTDVLSQAAISAHGILINIKVKELLTKYNIMEHSFYKCLVKDESQIVHDYYWLHISDNLMLERIDYKKSAFYTKEYGFRDGDITLDSFDDYKIQKERMGKMKGIGSDFLKLNNNFDRNLDLFCVPIFGKNLFISERLASALVLNKITGVQIGETNMLG